MACAVADELTLLHDALNYALGNLEEVKRLLSVREPEAAAVLVGAAEHNVTVARDRIAATLAGVLSQPGVLPPIPGSAGRRGRRVSRHTPHR